MKKENESTDINQLEIETDLKRATLVGKYVRGEQLDDHALEDLPKRFFSLRFYRIKDANGKEYEIPIDLPSH